MSLGGKAGQSKASDLLNALKSEGELKDEPVIPRPTTTSASAGIKSQDQQSVHVVVEEKVNVRLDREGGLQSVEVLGNLALTVQDAADSTLAVQCSPIDANLFQLKVNPKLSKDSFAQSAVLELIDLSRGLPVGSPQVLVKWRMAPSTDESRVPLMVNCWPSQINGGYSVNLDFELLMKQLVLTNVIIGIPLKTFGANPAVIQADGEAVFDKESQTLLWHINSISGKNTTGTLEFEIRGPGNVDSFFPISISFTSDRTYSGLRLVGVVDAKGANRPFSSSTTLSADQYLIS